MDISGHELVLLIRQSGVLTLCYTDLVMDISGHCPHDELPEDVNSIIGKWVVAIESGK